MSKDPAILFYTSDFMMGTYCMSHEQLGIYIRLLCIQHQCGGLIEKEAFSAMVGLHLVVKSKFIETENGFYNKRMDDEIKKRVAYSESRRQNRKNSSKNEDMIKISSSYDKHMENENENENRDRNIIKRINKFKKPTLEEVRNYCREIKSVVNPDTFFHTYESQGWIKSNGRPILNWKSTIRTWDIKQGKQSEDNRRFLS